MKRISAIITKSLVAVLISGGLLAASAEAQAASGMTAAIPFAFSANNQHVAAGTYKIKLLSDRFLSIRNVNTGREQVLMVRPEQQAAVEPQGRLLFHRYEGRYNLAEVRIAGTDIHSDLVKERGSWLTTANAGTAASSESLAIVALQ